MTRDQLLRTAAELGIPESAVQEAEAAHRQKAEDEGLLQQFQARQNARFFQRSSRSLLLALVFLGVFFISREDLWWALIVAAFMVIRFVAYIPEHFMRHSDGYQSAFARWKAKRGKDGG